MGAVEAGDVDDSVVFAVWVDVWVNEAVVVEGGSVGEVDEVIEIDPPEFTDEVDPEVVGTPNGDDGLPVKSKPPPVVLGIEAAVACLARL